MKYRVLVLARICILATLIFCLPLGCFEEEEYYFGTCAEDSDLRTMSNFYEGAICVDGKAQCPEGLSFCYRIAAFDERDLLISTCTGPCLECPNDRGACLALDQITKKMSYLCVDTSTDCWTDSTFLPLNSDKKRCPLMTLDCW